ASSYTWTVPAGTTIASGQGTAAITVNFSNMFTGSGNVCVRANTSCGNSAYQCLNVAGVPVMPGIISGPTGVCKKQRNVLYTTTAVSGATSYSWDAPQGAQVASGQGT